METIKDIASVVGCIMSCMALITAVCKPIRQKFVSFVIHSSGKDEVEKQLAEIKAMIAVPERMLANKRNDSEIGTARLPIILIGAQIGHGSHNPFSTPDSFWYFNSLYRISVNEMIASAKVTP